MMYQNAGRKVEILAVITAMGGFIASGCSFIGLLGVAEWLAVVVLIGGVLVSLIASWEMFAIGEAADLATRSLEEQRELHREIKELKDELKKAKEEE